MDMNYANELRNQIPGFMMQGAQTPIDAQMAAAGAPGQIASNYSQQLQSGPQSATNDLMSQLIQYMNFGKGTASTSTTQPLAPYRPDWLQQASDVSNSLQGVYNAWNPPQGQGYDYGQAVA